MKRRKVLRGRFDRVLDLAAPEWISAEARAVWNRTAPMLHKAGILTELDLAGLAVLCGLRAEEERTRRTNPDDVERWLGLVAEIRKWSEQYLMTPRARASVGFKPAGDGGAA